MVKFTDKWYIHASVEEGDSEACDKLFKKKS